MAVTQDVATPVALGGAVEVGVPLAQPLALAAPETLARLLALAEGVAAPVPLGEAVGCEGVA